MIVTAAEIAHPDYTAKTWHVYLLLVALLIIEGLLTMNSTKFLGWLNVIGTVANVLVLIIFVIWMPVGSINTPRTNSNHYVWTEIINGTEWYALPSPSLFLYQLIGACTLFANAQTC